MSHFIPFAPVRHYRPLTEDVVKLDIRQHPLHASSTPENKEKTRRPVDPPPIVQITVPTQYDPTSEYLVNPFLFMTATIVGTEPENGAFITIPGVNIVGQNVSSLHRLKDINNKDGGFFVFGDISCRKVGWFRMQFNLFDFDKNSSQVVFVTSALSRPFQVLSTKEFKGLQESTHLSRTFSDQGVRLRLRKEPRSLGGSKRGYDSLPADQQEMNAGLYGGPVHSRVQGQTYGLETPDHKRARTGSDHTIYGSASSQYSGTTMQQYGHASASFNWSVQPQHSFGADQSPYSSLTPHHQPQMGPNPSYQRYVQPDGYSGDSGTVSGNHTYSSNGMRTYGSVNKYQHDQSYPASTSQPQESRSTRDAYQSLQRLPVTTTLPEPSLVTSQSYDYSGTMPQTSGQVAGMGTGLLPDSIYGQNAPAEMKYGHTNNYHSSNNTLFSSSGTTSGLPDTTLSLDNGMLNRSFAPTQSLTQQSIYDHTNGSGMGGFKQEPQPYPTPNQASPLA